MYVCVECGTGVNHVYREFSKGNIRLTKCEVCGSFADKYVEYELMLLVLDLLLLRPAVYRHILFNRFPFRASGIETILLRLTPLYVILETYLSWLGLRAAYGSVVAAASAAAASATTAASAAVTNDHANAAATFAATTDHATATATAMIAGTIALDSIRASAETDAAVLAAITEAVSNHTPSPDDAMAAAEAATNAALTAAAAVATGSTSQWSVMLALGALNAVELAVYIVAVWCACVVLVERTHALTVPPNRLKWNYVVMSLLLSSFGTLFLLTLLIWDEELTFAFGIKLFVLASNVTALRAYLDCHLIGALCCIAAGYTAQRLLLLAVYVAHPTLTAISLVL